MFTIESEHGFLVVLPVLVVVIYCFKGASGVAWLGAQSVTVQDDSQLAVY